ncbi:nad dependent epimerase [Phlyctema vagabunda]|uniref:Nad dependent epimerase n=1 Tax=Phlyctema vagabunda TaxID=108571 RepID=A0ABR4PD39_9HELO
MPSSQTNVLVTGANGYIGNAVAHAFVRAGYRTYGLVRQASICSSLGSSEIIPLLGSPEDTSFIASLTAQGVVFGILVSATEDSSDYVPHYHSIISLFRTLAAASNAAGIRPLVFFTSGCKDYGMGALAGSPDLAPHTERSPLNPQPSLVNRASYAVKTFENQDLFDAVVLRPTHVYGYMSSFYAFFFRFAEEAQRQGEWVVEEDALTILHAVHVDDCADAYVALAESKRDVVAGQCYNISSRKYETLDEILKALVDEYEIKGGVKYVKREGGPGPRAKLFGFSQWVSSEKLRNDTGWKDKRMLFSEGIKQYRAAYEAMVERGDEGLAKMFQKVAARAASQK